MEPRLDFYQSSPAAIQAVMGLERAFVKSTLEKSLTKLVHLCASQVNGCAYCVDLHTAGACKGSENDRRLTTMSVWHGMPSFTNRERAALTWTEAATLVAETRVSDDARQAVRAQFSDTELVDFTLLASTINMWNHLAVSFRKLPA